MHKPEDMYVFQASDGMWYFWDETRLRTIGGYIEKEEAQEWCADYFNELVWEI